MDLRGDHSTGPILGLVEGSPTVEAAPEHEGFGVLGGQLELAWSLRLGARHVLLVELGRLQRQLDLDVGGLPPEPQVYLQKR